MVYVMVAAEAELTKTNAADAANNTFRSIKVVLVIEVSLNSALNNEAENARPFS